MMKAILKIDCQAPIGLEIPSTDLWAMPIELAAELGMKGMRELLTKAKTS
jgi:hypothetical protein